MASSVSTGISEYLFEDWNTLQVGSICVATLGRQLRASEIRQRRCYSADGLGRSGAARRWQMRVPPRWHKSFVAPAVMVAAVPAVVLGSR